MAKDCLVASTILCKKHSIDNSNILYEIVVGLLFESYDNGTKEVRELLKQKGISAVLEEMCGFEKGTFVYDNMVELYNAMKNNHLAIDIPPVFVE